MSRLFVAVANDGYGWRQDRVLIDTAAVTSVSDAVKYELQVIDTRQQNAKRNVAARQCMYRVAPKKLATTKWSKKRIKSY